MHARPSATQMSMERKMVARMQTVSKQTAEIHVATNQVEVTKVATMRLL